MGRETLLPKPDAMLEEAAREGMSAKTTNRLTLEQIHLLVPREERDGKYLCPRCHLWHLEIDGKTADFNCWTPDCKDKATKIAALIWAEVKRREDKPKQAEEPPSGPGMTLAEYASAKQLPVDFLKAWFGLQDGPHPYYKLLKSAVAFPYWNERGEEITQQWRWGMDGKDRRFLVGEPTYLYGGRFLQLLEKMAEAGESPAHMFVAEGESNTQTLSFVGLPTIGLPGANGWKPEYAKLKCLSNAKVIFVFQDPDPAGAMCARKLAESFEPGKVRAVHLPEKDVSALWTFHLDEEGIGLGRRGFDRELSEALLDSKAIIEKSKSDPSFPADIGDEVLTGVIKEFVDATLPHVQSDVNCLVADFLACAGSVIGKRVYANFGLDCHCPATFHNVIGITSSGKGSGQHAAESLFALVDIKWYEHGICRHFASGEAMVRVLSDVSTEKIIIEKEEETEVKDNPKYTCGRLLLVYNEIEMLFNASRRENATLSATFRTAYDGSPLENQRSKEGVRASNYLLTVLGSVTPRGLAQVLGDVDFANGVANRFIWWAVRQSKSIPRSERPPDYKNLASRIARLLPPEGSQQRVVFSEEAGVAWDAWYHSLPTGDLLLDEACGRVPANALRLCLTFAVLDEIRTSENEIKIEPRHVRAATAIMARHRATVEWYLKRKMLLPASNETKAFKDAVKCREAAAANGGQLTGDQLCKLFSHRTAEERENIAKAAGLKCEPSEGKASIWR